MLLKVERFNEILQKKWDEFVMNNSVNGTFLQTRRFLNYHPKDRFIDHSLIVFKGQNIIIAVIPACEIKEGNKKILYSHKGSTFGGIVINNQFNNIKHISSIVEVLEKYLREHGFNKIIFKNSSQIFSVANINLIDYFLFNKDYRCYDELSFYIDFNNYKDKIELNFTANKRRDYKKSLKFNLDFRKIETDNQILNFYNLLYINLKKFNATPVHTFEELIEFKKNILKDEVDFYGVFYNGVLAAGSMVFKFKNKVFHTQYLAAHPDYLYVFPMNFLNYNLIKTAKENNFRYFSFGISTENNGKKLNYSLAEFKEGFGATYSVNKTYFKKLK
ncbi:GNAT family N-acetyltransferase [Clostridium sp. ZS2-4]|uniref:GNAT family N-acetyltransferase n=1 Tax=Clostridium sp. ZS2-4 TaxID=2987703 RepID=UPI00227C7E8B|nr:GNAT family N-acetyltransferase [Clostridium sp. ZS2-4]MCY6356042.1 GNAT family N-acetyltransferase [Clostridium sp. ZS2-4]